MMREKLDNQLDDKLNRLGQAMAPGDSIVADVMRRIESAMPTQRGRARSILMKSAIAIAACILVGAGTWVFLGDGGASVTFAEVIAHIQSAETLTYTCVLNKSDGNTIISHVSMAPNRLRMDIEGDKVMILDLENSKALSFNPAEKTFLTSDRISPFISVTNVIEDLRTLPEKSEKELGRRVIDGRDAIGYEVEYKGAPLAVWADVETRLPVLIEAVIAARDGTGNTTLSDFVFDSDLPESLFSLIPPDGYVEQESVDPVLASARNLARRAISGTKLHHLAKACLKFANDHDGSWPDSLDDLRRYGITDENLRNPLRGDHDGGYVYLKPVGSPRPQQVVVHEAYDTWPGGINAAFGDGHVATVDNENEFLKMLEKSKQK